MSRSPCIWLQADCVHRCSQHSRHRCLGQQSTWLTPEGQTAKHQAISHLQWLNRCCRRCLAISQTPRLLTLATTWQQWQQREREQHLLGGHAATEEGRGCEIAAVARVGGAHHVLGIPHLLCQLGHGQSAVLLGAARGQGGEAHHKAVQPGEGDQIHCQLAQICVQLTCSSANILSLFLCCALRVRIQMFCNCLPAHAVRATGQTLSTTEGAKLHLLLVEQLQDDSLKNVPAIVANFSPGNRKQQVTPDITAEMRWLRSPKVGVVSLRVRKQMSYRASLSKICNETKPC